MFIIITMRLDEFVRLFIDDILKKFIQNACVMSRETDE